MTGLSHFGLKDISQDLDETEVNLDFKIAYLVSGMTGQQRFIFADIINDIQEKLKSKNKSTNSTTTNKPYEMQLPRTMNDLFKFQILFVKIYLLLSYNKWNTMRI